MTLNASLTSGGFLVPDLTPPGGGSGGGTPTLAPNASTESTLVQVRDAVRAQVDLASTIWTDDSGAFYVRRDIVDQSNGTITVSFANPAGGTATPGAGLRPAASASNQVTTDLFDVTTAGTGYSIGDVLGRVTIIGLGTTPPTATTLWLNLTTGLGLSTAPSMANVVQHSTLDTINAKLTAQGTRLRTADSLPNADSAAIQSVTTNASNGALFTVLASQACRCLQIVNTTSVDIEYQRGGSGAAMPIQGYGGSAIVVAVTNANQIGIRRIDQAATAVAIAVETYGMN